MKNVPLFALMAVLLTTVGPMPLLAEDGEIISFPGLRGTMRQNGRLTEVHAGNMDENMEKYEIVLDDKGIEFAESEVIGAFQITGELVRVEGKEMLRLISFEKRENRPRHEKNGHEDIAAMLPKQSNKPKAPAPSAGDKMPFARIKANYQKKLARTKEQTATDKYKAARIKGVASEYFGELANLQRRLSAAGQKRDAESVSREKERLQKSEDVLWAKEVLAGKAVSRSPSKLKNAKSSGRSKRLRIRAYIDGVDVLKIQGDKLWYEHLEASLPGKWNGNDHPTEINGKDWMPEWNGNISDPYVGLSPEYTPEDGSRPKVSVREGRGLIEIIDEPSSYNDSTLSVKLSDPQGAAEWLEILVRW